MSAKRQEASKASQYSRVWSNLKNSAAFSGLQSFVRSHHYKDSKKVLEQLNKMDSYALFKPARKKFHRRLLRVNLPYFLFQFDLMDTKKFSESNRSTSYILFALDSFSRRLWTAFLRDKSAKETLRGIKYIFRLAKIKPRYIMADEGKEFYNKTVMSYLEKEGIVLYSSHNREVKASQVERSISTIRLKLARAKYHKNEPSFIKLWNKVVASYNSTVHSSIGIAPNKVTTKNQHEVWNTLYGKYLKLRPDKLAFKPGDLVRVSLYRKLFEKGSATQRWGATPFLVSRVVPSVPVNIYYIKEVDPPHEEVQGGFYKEELSLINPK